VRTIAPEFSASIPSTVLACSALDEFQRLGVCGNDQITPVMTSLVSPQLHFHAYCSAVLLSTPPAPTHSKQVHCIMVASTTRTAQHEKAGEKQVAAAGCKDSTSRLRASACAPSCGGLCVHSVYFAGPRRARLSSVLAEKNLVYEQGRCKTT